MDHHQAIFFVIGETTALYSLSSVPLGTSLFMLLVSFVEHCTYGHRSGVYRAVVSPITKNIA
jgi:hypothetical protein